MDNMVRYNNILPKSFMNQFGCRSGFISIGKAIARRWIYVI